MARQRQSMGGFTPQALSETYMPGSGSMANSYSKIMGEQGLDPLKEQEDEQRKILNSFMEKARRGEVQGSGAYSKKFAPTAQGFAAFMGADAAYNLHQGMGGKAEADKLANANWSKLQMNY
jgi:hypothetical protein